MTAPITTPPTGTIPTTEVKTVGISPKVLFPTIIGLLVGAALLAIGLLSPDDQLKTIGVSVLLSAAGYGGVGYIAKPGQVAPK
jgi:hypothetical protein